MQYLVAVALVVGIIPCALAGQFYVAKSSVTKACRIIDVAPDGKTMMRVGPTSYATKAEAKAAKETAPECKAALR
jgi:hypothetical protein